MTSAGATPLQSQLEEPRTLEHLVGGACSSLQTPSTGSRAGALRAAEQGLDAAVQDSIFQLARQLKDRASVNQLPPELFLCILGHVRLGDVIAATLVCRHWRAVAIGAPNLWSDIRAFSSDGGGLQGAVAMLSRAGDAPVSLHLAVLAPFDELGDPLSENLHHLRLLDLRLELTNGDLAMLIQPVLRALTEPAPMLQDLRIHIGHLPRMPSEDSYVPDALFSHSAPVLESVLLGGLAIRSRTNAAFSAVRVLDIGHVEADFLRTIELYPRLEQLHVGAPRPAVGGLRQTVTARALELLEICGTVEGARAVSTQLVCLRPARVWMDQVDEGAVRYILEHSAPHTLRAVRLYVLFPTHARALKPGYQRGTVSWVLGPTVQTPVWALLAGSLAHVEDLALHELHWPLHLRALALPSLVRLEIVLDSFAAPSHDPMAAYTLEQYAGILYEGEASMLDCPILEELCFATPVGVDYAWTPLTVDVEDVCNFMTTRLRFAARHLPRLVLRNLRLEDPQRGPGLVQLTALVSAIEYRSAGPPQIPHLHRRANTMLRWVYSMIG